MLLKLLNFLIKQRFALCLCCPIQANGIIFPRKIGFNEFNVSMAAEFYMRRSILHLMMKHQE
jgi:hypothetical protein